MTHTKGIAIFAMVASLILATGMAAAQTPGAATTSGFNDDGNFSAPTSGDTVSTDPGHVYSANVSTQGSTTNWAGLYGNATGTLVLGDDSSRLYEWTARGEYVYATLDTNIVDFSSVSSATAQSVQGNFSFSQGSDNATETLTNSVTLSPTGTSVTTDGVQSYDGSSNPFWETGVIADANDNLLFTGVVDNTGATAYNSEVADYQAMVPSAGSAQTYSMYLELQ